MLRGLLPRVLPAGTRAEYRRFSGKNDLLKRVGVQLKAWRMPNCRFVVLCDKDNDDCVELASRLRASVTAAGRPDCVVRIACYELESWYLGDLAAVGEALGLPRLVGQQDKANCRTPDATIQPSRVLEKLTNFAYSKTSASRKIGPCLSLTDNRSASFHAFLRGVERAAK